jgi:hypothetical protein
MQQQLSLESASFMRYFCCTIQYYTSPNFIKLHSIYFIIIIISGVGLSPLGTAAPSGLLYKPQMIDEGDCGATGGMKIGRGNRSTRRKPAPAPLCPPQIPHDQDPGSNPGRRCGKPATNRLRGLFLPAAQYFRVYIGPHEGRVQPTGFKAL